jgi:hypothetical protein
MSQLTIRNRGGFALWNAAPGFPPPLHYADLSIESQFNLWGARAGTANSAMHSLLDFDTSSIPNDAQITGVTLRLYVPQLTADPSWQLRAVPHPSSYYNFDLELAEEVYAAIGSGATYADLYRPYPDGFDPHVYTPVPLELDFTLSAQALTDLQQRLSAGWFSVGIVSGNSDTDTIVAMGEMDTDYYPRLIVTYSLPDLGVDKLILIGKDVDSFIVAGTQFKTEFQSCQIELTRNLIDVSGVGNESKDERAGQYSYTVTFRLRKQTRSHFFASFIGTSAVEWSATESASGSLMLGTAYFSRELEDMGGIDAMQAEDLTLQGSGRITVL